MKTTHFTTKARSRIQSNCSADSEQLGHRITEPAAHIHAAIFHLLELIRELDERGGWHLDGVKSCAHWLNWQYGMNIGAGVRSVSAARSWITRWQSWRGTARSDWPTDHGSCILKIAVRARLIHLSG